MAVIVLLIWHMMYQLRMSYGQYCRLARAMRNSLYALSLWVAAIQGLALCFPENSFTCAIVAGVVICGVGIIALASWAKSPMECVASETATELGRICAALAALQLRSECAADESRIGNYKLTSFFAHHHSVCKDPCCPVSSQVAAGHCNPLKHRTEMLDSMLAAVSRMLKEFVIKSPSTIRLALFFLSFSISWTKNRILTWEIYSLLKRSSVSIIDRFLLYRSLYSYHEIEHWIGSC